MPVPSPFPAVEIPDLSVHEYLFGGLTDEERERIALIDGLTGAEITYGALAGTVDAVAGALAHHGLRKGDVVALHAPNIPLYPGVFHGILRAGCVATTVNALATASDIEKQLADSGAKLLVTVSPIMENAVTAARAVGLSDDEVVVLDGAEGFPSALDFLGAAAGAAPPEITIDPAVDLAVLPYSSGTTGRPKGVMLTHRNLVANVCQLRPFARVTPEDRIQAILPFFHIYGMTVLLNVGIAERATLVTLPKFELETFLGSIQKYRCTQLFIAPPIAVALAKHPAVEQFDLSSVRAIMSGAAPLDGKLGEAVAARLSCSMRQGYGMSELSPVSHAVPVGVEGIPMDSVGPAVPNVECVLWDHAEEREIPVPAEGMSAPGELWVRGPNVMLGYLRNEEATRETLDADGFLHTGDIATVDAAGNYYVIDRLKELIKYKGYQVPPAELEAVLLTHPGVADAAVIGVPDADGEEVPKAFVVPQQGVELAESEVIEFVESRVAPYKKVRQVEFIGLIPKSAAGKILRRELRG